MTRVINYTDAPNGVAEALANGIRVDDLLPAPEELIYKTEKEKITIAIDKHSLNLFREYAHDHNAKYQTMINEVLGVYADKFLKR